MGEVSIIKIYATGLSLGSRYIVVIRAVGSERPRFASWLHSSEMVSKFLSHFEP